MTMENIEIDSIIIKERLRVDNGDIDKLSENILEHGLLEPIILNSHNELIDGFRRLSALKMLSERFVPASIVDVTDIDGMLKIEYDANEFRKEFTKSEKMSFLHKYKNDHGLKQGGNNNPNGKNKKGSRGPNEPLEQYEQQKAKDSRKDENAKAAGFSNNSEAKRVHTIMKKAIPEVVKMMDDEILKVSTIANQVVNNSDEVQQSIVKAINDYGASKYWYGLYPDWFHKFFENGKLTRDNADGKMEAMERKPKKYTRSHVEKLIEDNYKTRMIATATANSTKRDREINDDDIISFSVAGSTMKELYHNFLTEIFNRKLTKKENLLKSITGLTREHHGCKD